MIKATATRLPLLSSFFPLVLVVVVLLLARPLSAVPDGTERPWRMHTLFSVECQNYFDWQTVGLMQSYRQSRQPGPITRLLSCTEEEMRFYRGMDLAPTLLVPSMSVHPVTGDRYPAINKPAGVVHWLKNSPDAKNVDWVVILDADMVIRHPITPWELGAEKGRPVAAEYGYLIGCDNILAKLYTKHPEYCDKVGGMLVFHIDDLQKMAPFWLSKTEEVRADKAHWATNITGDIYAQGWISEMYGYSFAAAEVGLRHKITSDLMIYPGYIPREGVEPILMHYGLTFAVGNWSFGKSDHNDDAIVYDCNRLFPAPPYPKQVLAMERDVNKRRGLFLSIECINTINEGLLLHHASHGCPKPPRSNYANFLRSWRRTLEKVLNSTNVVPESRAQMTALPKVSTEVEKTIQTHGGGSTKHEPYHPKIHTLFSAECSTYFDWQTIGLVYSFESSGQPGNITRLLSCTEEQLKSYKGLDLAPTHLVPSYSVHPLTGDWYPAINKPVAISHWLNHVQTDAEYIIILDADMILRGSITPEEFGAEKGHPVSVPYDYLVGCDNVLAQIHTRYPEFCAKVGGVMIIHINDLRSLAPFWVHKTEEVRADRAHWATNFTGDIYGQGWISEMYGYAFGAAEIKLRHKIRSDVMLYPGYIPPEGVEPRVLHYGLEFRVRDYRFDKADWHNKDLTDACWQFFPEPPDPSGLTLPTVGGERRKDLLSIECVRTINDALYLHHKRRGCDESDLNTDTPGSIGKGKVDTTEELDDPGDEITDAEDSDETTDSSEDVRTSTRTTLEEKSFLVQQRGLLRNAVSSPFISVRYWVIAVWSLLILGFFLIVSSRRRQTQRQKHTRGGRNKRPHHGSSMFANGESVSNEEELPH